eukprot:TRINITY_DN1566_c0_g2_i1.p1 TRINITY_DN1566_c0_g2~~TRINITY_DN1566_c0_g2_i1.p1  ORF type:complete len:1815 (-),score=421.25 TRINITY_DN1566_c0_g2_i1:71508-76952(-)
MKASGRGQTFLKKGSSPAPPFPRLLWGLGKSLFAPSAKKEIQEVRAREGEPCVKGVPLAFFLSQCFFGQRGQAFEVRADNEPGVVQGLEFAGNAAAGFIEDGAGVAEAFAGRGGAAGDKGEKRLGVTGGGHDLGELFFGAAADFADEHEGAGLHIVFDELETLGKRAAYERIATHADAHGLADAGGAEAGGGLIGEGAGAGEQGDGPGGKDLPGHDADFGLPRHDDARGVGPEKPQTGRRYCLAHIEHLGLGDAFGNADDVGDGVVHGFQHGVRGKSGRHEDDGRVERPGLSRCLGHAVENRHTVDGLPAFVRRDAGYNLGAVLQHELHVAHGGAAGDALDQQPGAAAQAEFGQRGGQGLLFPRQFRLLNLFDSRHAGGLVFGERIQRSAGGQLLQDAHGLAHFAGQVDGIVSKTFEYRASCLGAVSGQARHQRLGRRRSGQSFGHGPGYGLAGDDAAEQIEEDHFHAIVGKEHVKGFGHTLLVRGAAQVHKVTGAQARIVEQVHGGHGEAGAVGHESHPTVQTQIGKPGGARRVFLRRQVRGLVKSFQGGVYVGHGVVDFHLAVQRHPLSAVRVYERVDFQKEQAIGFDGVEAFADEDLESRPQSFELFRCVVGEVRSGREKMEERGADLMLRKPAARGRGREILHQRTASGRGLLFHIHTAAASHGEGDAFAVARDHEGEVELAVEPSCRLYTHQRHGFAVDLHGKQLFADAGELVRVFHADHATAFAPAAGEDLGLDVPGADAQRFEGRCVLRKEQLAGGHGNASLLQQLFGNVLVTQHEKVASVLFPNEFPVDACTSSLAGHGVHEQPIPQEFESMTSTISLTKWPEQSAMPLVDAAQTPWPRRLIVELTTRCNQRCPMCVKQSPGCGIEEGHMDWSVFQRLLPSFPQLDSLVLSGIGEPMLYPQLVEAVALARSSMPSDSRIAFQSNGVILGSSKGEDKAAVLMDAGLDSICLSVDSADPEEYRRLRPGGETSLLERAFSALRNARQRTGARFAIGVETVLLRDTLEALPTVLRWAAERGADYALVSHMLPFHPDMEPQAAWEWHTDEAIALFREYEALARSEGLSLAEHSRIAFKYTKSDEEKRLCDLVATMQREADARGLTIHPERLISAADHLEDTARRIHATMAKAREVAGAYGLDLRLPQVMPAQQRRCEFVESGAAFVALDGGVHPCHFLWHNAAIHRNAAQRILPARRFGSLRESDLFAIWNDPEYVQFRAAALRYDYPFCGSCRLGPCNLVEDADFDADCTGIQVPCGECPWALGLLQCLSQAGFFPCFFFQPDSSEKKREGHLFRASQPHGLDALMRLMRNRCPSRYLFYSSHRAGLRAPPWRGSLDVLSRRQRALSRASSRLWKMRSCPTRWFTPRRSIMARAEGVTSESRRTLPCEAQRCCTDFNAFTAVESTNGTWWKRTMNTLGGRCKAESRDWKRSATPKKNGPSISQTCTPSGTAWVVVQVASSSSAESMRVTSHMRRMKSSAASTTPTETATVRSTSTVMPKVRHMTATSDLGARMSRRNLRASLMSQETTTSTAARLARGMYEARSASSSTKASSTPAWMMPAMGENAPARMLVTVRAIAPVAGMPPKSTEPMLAAPCAESSTLELCVSPVMPSATTAESRDSIPASRAMVSASGRRVWMRSKVISGRTISGMARGMPPNLLPMVSTSSPRIHTARAASTTPTTGPGMRGLNLRMRMMEARARTAMATVFGLMVPACWKQADHFSTNWGGTSAMDRPKKSFICEEKMSTAMPAVNPVVTGQGIYLMSVPNRKKPKISSSTPAISVVSTRPSYPCLKMMEQMITTKAPVGPPI